MSKTKIVFLGDSTTEGCFEIFYKNDKVDTVRDEKSAYHQQLKNIVEKTLFKQIDTINLGQSGINTSAIADNLLLAHQENADVVVLSYGLNDVFTISKKQYINNLQNAFASFNCKKIFLTPNMMNTYVMEKTLKEVLPTATLAAQKQNSGQFTSYINGAKTMCKNYGIAICDNYKVWQQLAENGIDTNKLLSNNINHPTRDMHVLTAYNLLNTMVKIGVFN